MNTGAFKRENKLLSNVIYSYVQIALDPHSMKQLLLDIDKHDSHDYFDLF